MYASALADVTTLTRPPSSQVDPRRMRRVVPIAMGAVSFGLIAVLVGRSMTGPSVTPAASSSATPNKQGLVAGNGTLSPSGDGFDLLAPSGGVVAHLTLAIERGGAVSELKLASASGAQSSVAASAKLAEAQLASGSIDVASGPSAKLSLGGVLAGPLMISVGADAQCASLAASPAIDAPRNVGCVTSSGAFVLSGVVPAPVSEKNGWLDRHETRYLAANPGVAIGDAVSLFAAALREVAIEASERRGRVEPATPGARVIALDADGRAVSVASAGDDGAFVMVAPASATTMFATIGTTRVGPVVALKDAPKDAVVVPISPLGKLTLRARDHDTGEVIPVRFAIHGRDGTREPNLGPDFRASGAGSLADAEDGQLASVLPAGKYRVMATRGLEYTIDQRDVEVKAGVNTEVKLSVRRVIDTPHWAGCDFHVHSRGGFDSLVTIEDRVRTLASAGVDFAVPSEHNRIGSYAAVDSVGVADRLGWVKGVEVTTVDPLHGHFNVFPYALDATPPYRRTSLEELIRFVRTKTPASVLQINHPRFDTRIGYFEATHINPKTAEGRGMLPAGFDTIEVFNGFDLGNREKVEDVMLDWMKLLEAGRYHWATGNSDSHSAQYIWAGYPRTYVKVDDDHEDGKGPPVNVAQVVSGVKAGHAFVTSGPIVELTQGDHGPGDTLVVEGGKAKVHVKVRAAPWVDVRSVEIRVGAKVVMTKAIDEKPLVVGPPEGSLEDARHAAIRLDDDIVLDVPGDARSLLVVVKGERSAMTVLPYMDYRPLAFTNPLVRR